MFTRIGGGGFALELIYNRIFAGQISNIEELQLGLRRYFQRHLEEEEDQEVEDKNTNPNFLHEKDMKFRLYPLYINWKKIEANESGYYRAFLHFGYFGASIYSSYKGKYPSLTIKNIFLVLSTFISEYLSPKNNKTEETEKIIKEFMDKLPELEIICTLIQKKIIMFKEVPIFLIILKIYELYLYLNNSEELNKVIKYEYLLGTYLTEEEFKEIYQTHFKGKVSKLFKKMCENNGKQFELSRTKGMFFNHIKFLYKNPKSI